MRSGFPSHVSASRQRLAVPSAAAVLAAVLAASLLFWPARAEVTRPEAPSASTVPALYFTDADGAAMSLADFRGKAVLLNVWATWCVPCRKEMPALDRLQARLGGSDFEVAALSIDRGGLGAVRRFYEDIGIANLAIYLDESAEAMRALGIAGIPTTLLIDRDGREIRRWIGPAEWDGPDVEALIRSHVGAAMRNGASLSSNPKDIRWTMLPATRP